MEEEGEIDSIEIVTSTKIKWTFISLPLTIMARSKKEHPWNYEETIARVEAIIETIENGTLPLEVVFEQFSVAIEQLHECEAFLQKGQAKMALSIETLAQESTADLDF
jgi:exodeoxyribonuclease VII small subunit